MIRKKDVRKHGSQGWTYFREMISCCNNSTVLVKKPHNKQIKQANKKSHQFVCWSLGNIAFGEQLKVNSWILGLNFDYLLKTHYLQISFKKKDCHFQNLRRHNVSLDKQSGWIKMKGRFRLDIRKGFFTQRLAGHWNRLTGKWSQYQALQHTW